MRKRRGTTLIELMVALCLASLLLISISGVLGGMHKKNLRLKLDRMEDIQQQFHWLLWHDLAQARSASLDNGVFWLEIPSSHFDARSGTQLVSYQIVNDTKLPQRLVRTETHKENRDRNTSRVQTVLWNVHGLSLERIDSAGSPQPIPSSMGPAPLAVRYQLQLEGLSTPIQGKVAVR